MIWNVLGRLPGTWVPLLLVLPAAGLRLGAEEELAFAVPVAGTALPFPATHGAHPAFRIEWWYVTGHLRAADGRAFAFKTTFFRNAGPPEGGVFAPAGAPFGAGQLYLAHSAFLDRAAGRFWHQERLNRGGWDAAAAEGGLDLRNGPWSLRMTGEGHPEAMRLRSSVEAAVALDLALVPAKPRVVFGEDGVSRKGAAPDALSYYVTFPRLRAAGTVTVEGRAVPVEGLAWMDHEISSNQLDDAQVGWDWTCVQLDDGWDLMVYLLRRADGTFDPYSALVWVDPQGRLTHHRPADFRWAHRRFWTSPETGGRYPVEVALTTPPRPDGAPARTLRLRSLHDPQELAGRLGGIAYYEGACEVLDDATGRPAGQAFLELTGYADDLGRRL